MAVLMRNHPTPVSMDHGIKEGDRQRGVPNVLDDFLLNAMKTPKDRMILLKLDAELGKFMSNPKLSRLEFPPMSSYQRLLTHRVADYFGLMHTAIDIDYGKRAIILQKNQNSAIPTVRFIDLIKKEEEKGKKEVKILLRKRAKAEKGPQEKEQEKKSVATVVKSGSSTPEASAAPAAASPKPPSTPASVSQKSLEEREEEYARARARIFQESEQKTPTTGDPAPPSEKVDWHPSDNTVTALATEDDMYDGIPRRMYDRSPPPHQAPPHRPSTNWPGMPPAEYRSMYVDIYGRPVPFPGHVYHGGRGGPQVSWPAWPQNQNGEQPPPPVRGNLQEEWQNKSHPQGYGIESPQPMHHPYTRSAYGVNPSVRAASAPALSHPQQQRYAWPPYAQAPQRVPNYGPDQSYVPQPSPAMIQKRATPTKGCILQVAGLPDGLSATEFSEIVSSLRESGASIHCEKNGTVLAIFPSAEKAQQMLSSDNQYSFRLEPYQPMSARQAAPVQGVRV